MTPQTSDVAFRERRSDRLVIRRFRAEDAASLAAYRSDPATARYQSWDVPFSHAHARSFIEGLEGMNPDSPGEWFQFAMVEAATGAHIGDVAAGVDADDPRLATIGVSVDVYGLVCGAWCSCSAALEETYGRAWSDLAARNL